jgi:hypothetical protein
LVLAVGASAHRATVRARAQSFAPRWRHTPPAVRRDPLRPPARSSIRDLTTKESDMSSELKLVRLDVVTNEVVQPCCWRLVAEAAVSSSVVVALEVGVEGGRSLV